MSAKPKIVETLSINLKRLMDAYGVSKKELALKSGVSERMIGYVLACEKTATIQVTDDLASVFKLTGWQIIVPNLNADITKDGRLEKLLENYLSASVETRDYIDSIAEREVILSEQERLVAVASKSTIQKTNIADAIADLLRQVESPDDAHDYLDGVDNRAILIDKKRTNKR